MSEIVLRFVASDTQVSKLIRAQAGVCMPFAPSHVEALSRDGSCYVGQHVAGGCKARPIGYDAAEPNVREKLVSLPVADDQREHFLVFLESKIGEAYDWRAIVSFAALGSNFHEPDTAICSALMTLALRACGFFPMPLAVPAHHVSPRDLLLILSSHVEIDH